MDQAEAITLARQAIKLEQQAELIELLKAELQRMQAASAPQDEEIEVDGDFDLSD